MVSWNPKRGNAYSFLKMLGFSGKESEVAIYLLEAKNDKEIAQLMKRSENTVRSHIQHLYAKTNTHERAKFIKYLKDKGLPPSDDNAK